MVDFSKSFVSTYNGISNVLISEIHISKVFNPVQKVYQLNSDCKKYFAIWDTGVSLSVITTKVVQECGLSPITMVDVKSATTTERTYVYLVNLWLPNKLMIPNLRVAELKVAGADVLIGMDIINMGDFAVSNKNNKTIFTYRLPSMDVIDFVKNPYKEKPVTVEKKPERNDSCPCGSGKKYKKCCGKRT